MTDSNVIRKYLNILKEAETKTRSKSDPLQYTSTNTSQGDLDTKQSSDITVDDIKKADKDHAQQKIKTMLNDPEYRKHALNLVQKLPNDFFNVGDDGEEETEPQEPENLPAVQSQELSDDLDFEPEWLRVKQLPNYVSKPIRDYVREWFNQYTNVDNIGDMNFISTFTNPKDHVQVVIKWIQQNATKIDDAHVNFELIPGYKVDGQLYVTNFSNFMVARDYVGDEVAGYYVYMWPREDTENNLERSKNRIK